MTVEISPHRSLYGSINESEYSLEQSVGHLDPLELLGFLLDAENSHNNNLIEILGLIKPTKSAPCTSNLNLIIRGLFTKNSKILKILNNNYQDLLHESNPKDCFKNFINDFIIYLENGGLIIFQKYFDLFPVEYDYLIFAKPILHTQNYIDFIHNSTCLLRNPFVIEKLNNFADEMLDLVDNYNEHYESFKLNNITFNNTKLFGESLSTLHSSSPSSSSNLNRVSSFFKINQISERTKNENLFLANNSNQKIELVLLDLSNSNSYNALAILAIPDPSNIDQARSLIHPPLRVNEVSISFHSNTITLHALSFSKNQRSDDEICISGDQNILLSWYNKLSKIFPNSSSPISKKPTKEFQLSGLGINTYDYPSSPSSHSSPRNQLDKKASFKDLISSPSLSVSPLNQLSKRSNPNLQQPQRPMLSRGNSISSINSSKSFQQPPFLTRKQSTTSINSMDSNDSLKSRYDRSLDIIHKTLSNNSHAHDTSNQLEYYHKTADQITSKSIDTQFIKTINKNISTVLNEDNYLTQNRPISSLAKIVSMEDDDANDCESMDDDESILAKPIAPAGNFYEVKNNSSLLNLSNDYQRKQQNIYSSVPDLSETKPPSQPSNAQSSLYQLSSGSAIDINNFGKNHNPSFSIPKNLSELAKPASIKSLGKDSNNSSPSLGDLTPPMNSSKSRRKSIFSFFKKNKNGSKSSLHNSTNASSLSLDQTAPERPDRTSPESTDKSLAKDELSLPEKARQKSTVSNTSSNSQNESSNYSVMTSSTTSNGIQKPEGEITEDTSLTDESERPLNDESSSNYAADCESFAPPRSLSSKASSSSINQKNLTINTTSLEEAERLRLSTISEKSDTPTPKMAASTSLPSPFALPSSTSTYFFKPYKNATSATASPLVNENQPDSCSTPATPKDVDEEHLYIPQSLKDVINSDSSIDFYITPTSPKAMKVSKWKQKYGKWEMLTVNENIFLKIVANYDLNKSWLIFFKEEYDDTYDEVIDKPIMLMNINEESSIRHSSALDLQVNSTDSISNQSLLIMIRCTNGSFASSIHSNYKNILGVIKSIPKNKSVAHSLGFNDSNVTSSSSLMEKPSNSSTFTSLNSSNIGNDSTIKQPALKTDPILGKEISFASLNSDDITNANIISNPDNSKMLLLNQMTVRLQKQLDSYSAINIPSSWEILSMFSLSIFLINDSFTHKAYYNLILENNNIDNDDPAIETFNWLIGEDEKFNRIERIGKAGLLIKAGNDEIFMIECKGKKEFKHLFEIF